MFTLLERDPKGVNDESEDSELEEDGALYTQINDEYKQNVIIFYQAFDAILFDNALPHLAGPQSLLEFCFVFVLIQQIVHFVHRQWNIRSFWLSVNLIIQKANGIGHEVIVVPKVANYARCAQSEHSIRIANKPQDSQDANFFLDTVVHDIKDVTIAEKLGAVYRTRSPLHSEEIAG